MRQVFSSARIENVEAVAKMLEAEGIEVRIEHGRSFKRAIRGNFSYRDDAGNGPKPALWVVRSDDQPRARQLLREAGLLDAQSSLPSSFLPQTPHAAIRERDARDSKRRAARYRYGLVILAAIVAAAIWFKPRPDAVAPTTATAAIDPSLDALATAPDTLHLLPTPPALAATIAMREHAARPAPLCLGIDGGDPPAATLDALREDLPDVHAASACPDPQATRVEVYAWRTDGSGSGTVTWSVGRDGAQARVRSATARRDGDDWQVDAAP